MMRCLLKLFCMCILLSIGAIFTTQLQLDFYFTPKERVLLMLNSDPASPHHNRLSYVEEFGVLDKRLKFGLNHPMTANQSKYKKVIRKRNGEDIELADSEDYSKHGGKDVYYNHNPELTQKMLDDIVSLWDLEIPLRIELDCLVTEGGCHCRHEDGVLVVCLSASSLINELDTKRRPTEHLKLLVCEHILNELCIEQWFKSSNGVSTEAEKFHRSIAILVRDLLSGLKIVNGEVEEKKLMEDPNSSKLSANPLSLHNIMTTQSAPAHHKPLPLPIHQTLLSSSAQRDTAVKSNAGHSSDQQRSNKAQEHPFIVADEANLTQSHVFLDQHTTQVKVQDLHHANYMSIKARRTGVRARSHNIPNLQGFMIRSYKSLHERGFHTDYSFDSPELLQRRKYITSALEGASMLQKNVAKVSLSTNLLKRGKYQHQQIQRYCKSENISTFLPDNFMELDILFKHLLYDDSKKIVFCYVPKNSCSNMKRMMLILNGIIPTNSSQGRRRPSESVLRSVHSFRNLSREGAIYRLENYYKFSVLRNPMERLLSAYRNKLEKPLNYALVKKFPDRLKAFILVNQNRSSLLEWLALKNTSINIHPSFSDTLDFMTKFSLKTYNEHFLPVLKLCHPCALNYDLFLNVKSMNYDIFALMEYMGIPLQYFPSGFKSSITSDIFDEYYQQVSQKIKARLYDTFAKELNFYYAMYQEEL